MKKALKMEERSERKSVVRLVGWWAGQWAEKKDGSMARM